jgi:hypothetical protein
MKKIIIAMALLSMSSLSQAGDDSIESYTAKLGEKDHFNSNGERLKTAAAILRQDRANFHEFGIIDAEDEETGDNAFFAKKANRGKLEAMLKRGALSKETEKAILNGTPVVHVTVYKNRIDVSL